MLDAVPAGPVIVADVKDPRVMRATIEVAKAAGRLDDMMAVVPISPRPYAWRARSCPSISSATCTTAGNLKQTLAYLKKTRDLGARIVSIHERATQQGRRQRRARPRSGGLRLGADGKTAPEPARGRCRRDRHRLPRRAARHRSGPAVA